MSGGSVESVGAWERKDRRTGVFTPRGVPGVAMGKIADFGPEIAYASAKLGERALNACACRRLMV